MKNKKSIMSHNACYDLTRSVETDEIRFYTLSIRVKGGEHPDDVLTHHLDQRFNSPTECISYIHDILVDLVARPFFYSFSSIQSFCIHRHTDFISKYNVIRKG